MAAKINNQKGFATIEIIFVMLIISILAGIVIPKFSRSLDILALDYETKKFVNTFYFAKSINRTANFATNKFFNLNLASYPVQMNVYEKYYYLKRHNDLLRDKNYLSPGISIESYSKNFILQFSDEEDYYRGSSENVTIKSQSGRKSELVIDSVGRIRKKS